VQAPDLATLARLTALHVLLAQKGILRGLAERRTHLASDTRKGHTRNATECTRRTASHCKPYLRLVLMHQGLLTEWTCKRCAGRPPSPHSELANAATSGAQRGNRCTAMSLNAPGSAANSSSMSTTTASGPRSCSCVRAFPPRSSAPPLGPPSPTPSVAGSRSASRSSALPVGHPSLTPSVAGSHTTSLVCTSVSARAPPRLRARSPAQCAVHSRPSELPSEGKPDP